jgi:molybdopterin-biosynthesis enzyme MoeA-like protein
MGDISGITGKENERESMNSTEIDLLKTEKEKELREAQKNLHEVELAELELSKQIVDLQAQRKPLQIAISKARHTVRTLSLDIKILISEFWAARNG